MAERTETSGARKRPWDVARDWAAFTMSAAAFLFSALIGYYTAIRRVDDLSVVFDATPSYSANEDNSRIEVLRKLGVVFINSGSRPAVILRVRLHLWEGIEPRKSDRLGEWNCGYEEKIKHRILDAKFDPFVVKEKEILRKELIVSGGWSAGEDARNDDEKISLPLPNWFKKGETEYWISACASFQIATPSDSYGIGSVEIDQTFAITKTNYFHSYLSATIRPYRIWYRPSTIFSD